MAKAFLQIKCGWVTSLKSLKRPPARYQIPFDDKWPAAEGVINRLQSEPFTPRLE